MKILFFFPKLEPHKDFHHIPVTALAVAGELLAQGHEVTIWDDRVIRSHEKIFLPSMAENVDEIMMSAFTGFQLSQAHVHAKMFKRLFPNKKITLGGPHASALPEQTLADPYIDEVFVGEMDTGQHPLPYYLIDVSKYINPETKRFIYVSSYGCPGVCTFCSTKRKRPYLPLPTSRVMDDFENVMSLYPFEECVLFDATAFAVEERVKFISNVMHIYKLRWIADARAPEIAKIDNGLLERCVRTGLQQLTIGLESGSPDVLYRMKKGHNHLLKFQAANLKLKELPVKLVSGVVFGTPGETVADLQKTIDFIKWVKNINPNFFVSTTFYRPLPGTEMADMCREYGYKEPDSLAEWAELGQRSHYNYNQWVNSPWIIDTDEYRKIYEQFRQEYADLFV